MNCPVRHTCWQSKRLYWILLLFTPPTQPHNHHLPTAFRPHKAWGCVSLGRGIYRGAQGLWSRPLGGVSQDGFHWKGLWVVSISWHHSKEPFCAYVVREVSWPDNEEHVISSILAKPGLLSQLSCYWYFGVWVYREGISYCFTLGGGGESISCLTSLSHTQLTHSQQW